MLYLLDVDTLIRADSTYYPLKRFPNFWEWLRHNGAAGRVKIPLEQYEEVVVGKGDLVDWLKEEETKAALVFDEEADPALVRAVTDTGYAPDLNEAEQEEVGRDPFLIAYAYAAADRRFVVTFEVSSPAKRCPHQQKGGRGGRYRTSAKTSASDVAPCSMSSKRWTLRPTGRLDRLWLWETVTTIASRHSSEHARLYNSYSVSGILGRNIAAFGSQSI